MNRIHIRSLAIFVFILSACGNQESSSTAIAVSATPGTTIPTGIPDPCSSENLKASIKPVNDLQREFDDASLLASNVAREQLPPLITEMQRIRRAAEDQSVPPCLATLKSRQLAHMNTVLVTLIAFVSGADTSTLNNGIAQASLEHDLYTLELAGLLGVTFPATNAPPPSGTQSP